MIRPNSDADVCKEACPSLLEWANYLLDPCADIESKDDSKVNSDNNQKGPMLSYKITDDEIKWKKEPATETTQANASTPIIGEEWCKYDFDVWQGGRPSVRMTFLFPPYFESTISI